MKIKNITIETDNGDEITMSLKECEKFFKAYQRLKEAAEPKPKQPEMWPYVPIPNTWPQQNPLTGINQPQITWGSSSTTVASGSSNQQLSANSVLGASLGGW